MASIRAMDPDGKDGPGLMVFNFGDIDADLVAQNANISVNLSSALHDGVDGYIPFILVTAKEVPPWKPGELARFDYSGGCTNIDGPAGAVAILRGLADWLEHNVVNPMQ